MKNLLTYLLAILALVACSDSGPESGGNGGGGQEIPKQPEITLSTTAADFSTDGGSNVITFTSSEAWTAQVVNSRADDWCSIEPTSGPAGSAKITVTTTENNTPDDRTASVIIKAGTASKTINVSQKQKDALTVTSSKFEVSAEGGEITIEVKANINFDFEIDEDAEDWITHRSTRALKTSQLVFEIDENEATENRKANISISSGNLRETVTIYQEGNEPTIILSDDEFTVSSSKETIAIDVKSNVDVAVEIPSNVNWIKENTTRTYSTNTYYFDIAQNDGYDARTAEIEFVNKENGVYEKVKITQMQRDTIVIADSEYTFDENGGELDFEIKTNVEFKVSISSDAQSWIKQVDTRGLQSKTLHFDIAANDSDNDREGTITLSGGDAKQIIKVKQVVTPCQIIYTSTDGKIITPNTTAFGGAKIVSNVYENGQGVMTFDKTILEIGDYAFRDTAITSINIPDKVTSVGNNIFYRCMALTSIGGKYASSDNRSLVVDGVLKSFAPAGITSYTIPENITQIGYMAFRDCTSLTNINIPDGVTQIGDSTFRGCSSLSNITIPDGVTQIGSMAFTGCISLVSVTIPEGATEIRYGTFNYCTSLTSITLPEGVMSIGGDAFSGCTSLASVTLPQSLAYIGDYAFAGCDSLVSIVIPEGVTEIVHHAFSGCTSLASIDIPDRVTKIGFAAFRDCPSLASITIPDSVTEIEGDAFYGCSNLASINIPEGVTEIKTYTFGNCRSLTSIVIPESVTTIEELAFYNCTSLVSVYCKPITPPSINSATFNDNVSGRKFYVPTESADDYKAADGWKSYSSAIVGYDFDGESGSDDPSESEDDSELENPEDGGTTDW